MQSEIWMELGIKLTVLPGSACLFLFHVLLVLQFWQVPLQDFCFQATEAAAAQLMMLGVITIILNGNSNISNGVLQGIGKPNIPMINAAIALVVDVCCYGNPAVCHKSWRLRHCCGDDLSTLL